MNKTVIASAIICLLATPVVANSAESYDNIVTGKSDPAYDVKQVQEAVDQGGTVLLKGNFDFGDKGRVVIKNDIKIFGEADNQGVPLTKITGGHWTFFTPLPSTETPPQAPGPKIRIQNIHFDKAVWTPIHFPYTSGAIISGNRMTNVVPFELPIKWEGGETLWVHTGALFGTRFIYRDKVLPTTTGHLIFENNEVDIPCDNPKITMGQGVFFLWTWGAVIEVKGNTFRNVSRNSIESLDNYRNEAGQGMVIIKDNEIVTPTDGCPFPGPTSYPNGIVVGWFLDMSGGKDPIRNSKIVVMNNYVGGRGNLSGGIISLGDGTVVINNEIVLAGGSESKAITQIGSNGFIANNTIRGSGAWALRALKLKDLEGNSNTFAWNDVKLFKASSTDFLCMGNNNLVVGSKCKVLDEGQNNMILEGK